MTTRHVSGLGLTLAAAVLSAGCSDNAQTAAPVEVRKVPVRTATVTRQTLTDEVTLTGTLKPRNQVQIVAEVPARLLRIVRDEGMPARAGEVLAVLDPTDHRLSLDRARAAVAVAEANQAHSVAEKERADSLVKTGGITDKDRLSAEVSARVAEAALAQARAEAAIAAQQLARTEVRAPFSGRVARRLADAGSMLAVGAPLLTFVDDDVLEFRASAPAAYYARVRVGAAVTVTTDALPGSSVTGRVARITPLVDERNRSFEVVVEVPGGGALVGGLFARASVRTGEMRDALVLPPAALVRDGSGSAEAFVVTAGKAERRTVVVGGETSDAVQVVEGLREGEVVVVSPPVALSSGAPVEIQNRK
jgi:membrane fusion protein, multidrug efflux system